MASIIGMMELLFEKIEDNVLKGEVGELLRMECRSSLEKELQKEN